MSPHRRTSVAVGVLFVIASVAGLLTVVFVDPLLDDPDLLVGVAANENQIVIGGLLDLILAVAVIGIAVMLFPVLKRQNEGLALGYVAARVVEAVFITVGVFNLLNLVTLSRQYAEAGTPDTSFFANQGALLVEAREWIFLLAPVWIFSITALILNYLLYRSDLVPRYISAWGFVGAAWLLVGSTFYLFGNTVGEPVPSSIYIFVAPIAINEIVLAAHLLVKGFNPASPVVKAT